MLDMLHASIFIINYRGTLCGPTWDAKWSYLELQAVSQNENLTQYYLMCNLGFLSPNRTKQIINLWLLKLAFVKVDLSNYQFWKQPRTTPDTLEQPRIRGCFGKSTPRAAPGRSWVLKTPQGRPRTPNTPLVLHLNPDLALILRAVASWPCFSLAVAWFLAYHELTKSFKNFDFLIFL